MGWLGDELADQSGRVNLQGQSVHDRPTASHTRTPLGTGIIAAPMPHRPRVITGCCSHTAIERRP
jgi:hypothetical protein